MQKINLANIKMNIINFMMNYTKIKMTTIQKKTTKIYVDKNTHVFYMHDNFLFAKNIEINIHNYFNILKMSIFLMA